MRKLIVLLIIGLGFAVRADSISEIEKAEVELSEQALMELKDRGATQADLDKMLAIEDRDLFFSELGKQISPELRTKILDLQSRKKELSKKDKAINKK